MIPRVLYITGWTRSGSTLLGNVLGELPGVLHVGEMHYLWKNGILGMGTNSTCGCGDHLRDCSMWSAILTDSAVIGGDPHSVLALQSKTVRTRHTVRRLLEARTGSVRAAKLLGDRIAGIYRHLSRMEGQRLIVDSSKFPAEAALLLGRSDIEVKVIHIVRDPRATAFSYGKSKSYIESMSPAICSGYWTAFNLASEAVGYCYPDRYLRVRYEDICADPPNELTRLLRFAGLPDSVPLIEGRHVDLGVNHTVTGNPDRFSVGRVGIRSDRQWINELHSGAKAAATAPALPLLHRYGYRVA